MTVVTCLCIQIIKIFFLTGYMNYTILFLTIILRNPFRNENHIVYHLSPGYTITQQPIYIYPDCLSQFISGKNICDKPTENPGFFANQPWLTMKPCDVLSGLALSRRCKIFVFFTRKKVQVKPWKTGV